MRVLRVGLLATVSPDISTPGSSPSRTITSWSQQSSWRHSQHNFRNNKHQTIFLPLLSLLYNLKRIMNREKNNEINKANPFHQFVKIFWKVKLGSLNLIIFLSGSLSSLKSTSHIAGKIITMNQMISHQRRKVFIWEPLSTVKWWDNYH